MVKDDNISCRLLHRPEIKFTEWNENNCYFNPNLAVHFRVAKIPFFVSFYDCVVILAKNCNYSVVSAVVVVVVVLFICELDYEDDRTFTVRNQKP